MSDHPSLLDAPEETTTRKPTYGLAIVRIIYCAIGVYRIVNIVLLLSRNAILNDDVPVRFAIIPISILTAALQLGICYYQLMQARAEMSRFQKPYQKQKLRTLSITIQILWFLSLLPELKELAQLAEAAGENLTILSLLTLQLFTLVALPILFLSDLGMAIRNKQIQTA